MVISAWHNAIIDAFSPLSSSHLIVVNVSTEAQGQKGGPCRNTFFKL